MKFLTKIEGLDVDGIYDTVISSQQEFEEWYKQLDDGTYKGESVLIKSGTYERSDGKGLHLPDTLKQLHGLGTVKINITNFEHNDTNKGGIWYTITPTAKGYSIENISLSCVSSGSIYGFHSCTNLTNCTSSGTSAYSGYGFYSCKICSNCRADPNNASKTATWGGTNTNVDLYTCPEYPH